MPIIVPIIATCVLIAFAVELFLHVRVTYDNVKRGD